MGKQDLRERIKKDRGIGFWLVIGGVGGAILLILLVVLLNLVYD